MRLSNATSNNQLVWIASYPKSGNTWFRIFLSNLISDSNSPQDINSLKISLFGSGRKLFDDYAGVNSSDLTEEEIDLIKPEVYKNIAIESDSPLYLKTHEAWRRNIVGAPIFPVENTKAVIYLIRNPLDIAVSYSYHSDKSISEIISGMNDPRFALASDTGRLYDQLKQVLFDWSYHVISWVDNSKMPILVLRYEDILNDSYSAFKKAIDFLGMHYRKSEILTAIKHSKFENIQAQEEINSFKEKPILSEKFFKDGKAGNWKDSLTKENIETVKSKHAEVMARFKYI